MEETTLPNYVCPGDTHAISRAVHLARLATGYPDCVDCPHRHDEEAAGHVRRRIELAEKRAGQTLLWRNGIRGLYRNDLTRERMERVGSAVASMLWERTPRRLTLLPDHRRPLHAAAARTSVGPRIVVGHDTRFSSADLTIGLVTGLRRAGCTVVDVGLVHRPALDFAVDHFHADLGLFVTGGGHAEDWNGLDLVEGAGLTWSTGGRLDELRDRLQHHTSRPSRTIGPCRTVTILESYAAGLLQHFHALRPLRVAVTCANPITAGVIEELSPRLPCQLRVNSSPLPFGEEILPPAKLMHAMADAVHREHLDLGVLIASDGRACHVLDECGELLATGDMLSLLAQTGESPTAKSTHVVVPRGCRPSDCGLYAPLETPGETEELLVSQMLVKQAWLATDDQGRYWRPNASPACDAVVTLARVLQFFSLSDQAASRLLRR